MRTLTPFAALCFALALSQTAPSAAQTVSPGAIPAAAASPQVQAPAAAPVAAAPAPALITPADAGQNTAEEIGFDPKTKRDPYGHVIGGPKSATATAPLRSDSGLRSDRQRYLTTTPTGAAPKARPAQSGVTQIAPSAASTHSTDSTPATSQGDHR